MRIFISNSGQPVSQKSSTIRKSQNFQKTLKLHTMVFFSILPECTWLYPIEPGCTEFSRKGGGGVSPNPKFPYQKILRLFWIFWQKGGSRNFCKTQTGSYGWKKSFLMGVKPPKILPFFLRPRDTYKNTFCKKIGSKRSFQPSAVVRAIYTPLYGVPAAN